MEEKFNPAYKYPRHHTAHPKGGVHLTEQAAKVKDVGLSVLKSLGIKIKEEGLFDLLKISRPAIVSYHKSYLECIAEDYTHTKFINKAAECTDPLERLKWVICFYISGIYRNPAFMQNLGPLNPVLGETYIAEKADGTTVYCEQISHHPAVSAYMMVGPNKSYVLSGTGELDAKMKGFNNITGKRIGKTTINFKDGGKIVFTNPEARIDGLLVGDRRLNYINTCVFLDKVHNLSAEINFLYEPEGTMHKLTSRLHKWFGSSSHDKLPGDNFEAVFFKYHKQPDGEIRKEILCEGTGSYLSHIQFDGKIFWKIDDKFDDPWKFDAKKRLPSDSLCRSDAKLIKIKDFESAQREKDILEERQRADAKLRAHGNSRQK